MLQDPLLPRCLREFQNSKALTQPMLFLPMVPIPMPTNSDLHVTFTYSREVLLTTFPVIGWLENPCAMETKMGRQTCGQRSKGGHDIGDSQDGNKGGCWRHVRFMHQAFPLVNVMVWGSIPQCGIFLLDFLQQKRMSPTSQETSLHEP